MSSSPKSVREALCAAQAALAEWARNGMDAHTTPHRIAQIGVLIAAIDEHRPLGSNGKHGERRHTDTCGCEGHRRSWAIELHPEAW